MADADLGLEVGDWRDLLEHLAQITDPRVRRGVRHAFTSLVGVAVAAVVTGARSFTAIGEWVAGAPDQVLAALGVRPHRVTGLLLPPHESTIRRVLNRTNDAQVAGALGAWLAERIDAGTLDDLLGLAVDGKSVRGAVRDDGRCVHLLSAMLHSARATLAQREVDHKTNEITQVQPLLANLQLPGTVVVTADALHTQRAHAEFLRTVKGWHFIFPVAENQPTLFGQLDSLPWTEVPIAHTQIDRGHGRIDKRTIQVLPAPADPAFPHVSQVFLIERAVHDLNGKLTSAAAVLSVSSLTADQATPAQIAALVRGQMGDRKRQPLRPRRHLRRGRQPGSHRHRTRRHGRPTQLRDRRAPLGRFHQHRPRTTLGHRDYRHPLNILDLRI